MPEPADLTACLKLWELVLPISPQNLPVFLPGELWFYLRNQRSIVLTASWLQNIIQLAINTFLCHTQNKPPSPDFAMICAGIHSYRSVLCLFSSEAIMYILLNCPVSYLNVPSKWSEILLLIWLSFSFPRWLVYMSAVTSFLCATRIITHSYENAHLNNFFLKVLTS